VRIPGRRGNTVLEAALFIPILLTLLVSTEQLGKLTYTYYSLKKALNTVARYVGTQQGVNFCDASDPNIAAGLNLATTGTSDGSAAPLIAGFTSDMVSIAIERYDPVGQTLGPCDCSNTGCDISLGGSAPDYIVVSIPNGFNFLPNIPFLRLDAIPLRPTVKVPYGGT
jgi:hypothetical protein